MSQWTLTVRSTFLATQPTVWSHKTDPEALSREFSPWLTLTVPDPAAVQRAMRERTMPDEPPRTFRGRIGGPLGLITLPWPMTIEATEPPEWYRDASDNALYSAFSHTHHVRASGPGRTVYIDEVVFTPRIRPSWLTAQATRALFLHRHARAALELPADAVEGTRATLARGTSVVRAPLHPATPSR